MQLRTMTETSKALMILNDTLKEHDSNTNPITTKITLRDTNSESVLH